MYRIIDAKGDIRFITDRMPCPTKEYALELVEVSTRNHSAAYPQDYPMRVEEVSE